MISGTTLLFALLGGFLPALLWVWFWLEEDRKNPEPRGLIMLAFFAGMIAVPLVLPLEKATLSLASGGLLLFLWAAIEEIVKFALAFFAVLWRKDLNEPIDAMIYMITVAVGFAALENTFFLLNPLVDGNISTSILTGNFRFIGATLLHTLSSATVGAAIALSFYRPRLTKQLASFLGIILAILLHTLFNFSIMKNNGENLFLTFGMVWVGIVFLIFLFEVVKRMRDGRGTYQ